MGGKKSFTHKLTGIPSTLLENPVLSSTNRWKNWWEIHLSFPHTPIFWTSGPTSALVPLVIQWKCPKKHDWTRSVITCDAGVITILYAWQTKIEKTSQVVTSTISEGTEKHRCPKWLPKETMDSLDAQFFTAGRNVSDIKVIKFSGQGVKEMIHHVAYYIFIYSVNMCIYIYTCIYIYIYAPMCVYASSTHIFCYLRI